MAENSGDEDCVGGESINTELDAEASDGSLADSALDAGECSAC